MRQREIPHPGKTTTERTQEVLIFDLFGVIAHGQSQKDATRLEEIAGADADDFWKAYWALRPPYDRGEVTGVQYWASVGRRFGASYNPQQKQELIAQDISSWSRVNDHMVELLEDLAPVRRLALLSNIPHEIAEYYITCHKWLGLFEVRAFSNYMGYAKPELEAYKWCLGELDIDPGQALFIDDRAENVLAAQNLGIGGHLFTSLTGLTQKLHA